MARPPSRLRRRPGPGPLRPRQLDRSVVPAARGRGSRRRPRLARGRAGDQRRDARPAAGRPRCRSAFTGAWPARARPRRRRWSHGSPPSFLAGMAGEANRSRRLGDVGANAPDRLALGRPRGACRTCCSCSMPSPAGSRPGSSRSRARELRRGFRRLARPVDRDLGDIEPFGFADGISQPVIDWERTLRRRQLSGSTTATCSALGRVPARLSERVRQYTDRPLLDRCAIPGRRPAAGRGGRTGATSAATAAISCCASCSRTCAASGSISTAGGLATPASASGWPSAMVGRTRDGRAAGAAGRRAIEGVGTSGDQVARQRLHLRRRSDGDALPDRRAHPPRQPAHRRPAGRHVRASGGAPAHARLRAPTAFRDDLVASARFHRLLRRGRDYGTPSRPRRRSRAGRRDEQRGLHFICLGRQHRAPVRVRAERLDGRHQVRRPRRTRRDPLLRQARPLAGRRRDRWLHHARAGRPGPNGSTGLPQFVTVRGGAYFFLPGIRALRFIAGA